MLQHGCDSLQDLDAFLLASPALADPIEPSSVRVLDGDTIEARGAVFRLVGFDTPESGRRTSAGLLIGTKQVTRLCNHKS